MSRIVIDARELRTSTGRYVERLLFYLQKLDKQNDYKVLLKPDDIDSWEPINVNFEKIACLVKEFSFAEQLALKNQIESLRADLVHFTMAQQPIWYKGKTVTTIHDLTTLRFNNPAKNIVVFKLKQRVYGFVIKRAVAKADTVITPSKYVKNDLVKYSSVKPSKVVVTYEAAEPIKEASEPVIELTGKQFIMYIGRPTPHKNLNRLIKAYISLKKTHPGLVLALAGKKDINYRQIENKVQADKIQGIVFTDFVSEGQLKWMYQNCQAYVFPSLSEGFGLPGLEAMVHGAPVVSSNATCLPEIYKDAVHYFDPKSIKSMVESIDDVLTNKRLRQALVKKGHKLVLNYSWETMAKQTLAIYKDALKTSN